MDDAEFLALAAETKEHMDAGNYAQWLKKLDSYLQTETDPKTRAILNTGKANCAILLNDFPTAQKALAEVEIDRHALSDEPEALIYLDKIKLQLLEENRDWHGAKELLTHNLAKPELQHEEQWDVRYEFLGKMGCALANLGEFKEALKYLRDGQLGTSEKVLLDSFHNYEVFCLRSLGLHEEAEKCLNQATVRTN